MKTFLVLDAKKRRKMSLGVLYVLWVGTRGSEVSHLISNRLRRLGLYFVWVWVITLYCVFFIVLLNSMSFEPFVVL